MSMARKFRRQKRNDQRKVFGKQQRAERQRRAQAEQASKFSEAHRKKYSASAAGLVNAMALAGVPPMPFPETTDTAATRIEAELGYHE